MAVTGGPSWGSLLVHGGDHINDEFKELFRTLAGGPDSTLVCIPSAASQADLRVKGSDWMDRHWVASYFGFQQAVILHANCREEADNEEFVKPLRQVNAAFIAGGRQWRLADLYLGTRTHLELGRLLEREGVIAGSSAGATILGSFLVRGNANPDDNTIMIGDHQQGFGFITNVAIDQHIRQKRREADLGDVVKCHPGLLGIGVDEDTAIQVREDRFTVRGRGFVFVHDGRSPYYLLRPGDEYDLRSRRVGSVAAS